MIIVSAEKYRMHTSVEFSVFPNVTAEAAVFRRFHPVVGNPFVPCCYLEPP